MLSRHRLIAVLSLLLVAAGLAGYISGGRRGRRKSSASCELPKFALRRRSAAKSPPSKCTKATPSMPATLLPSCRLLNLMHRWHSPARLSRRRSRTAITSMPACAPRISASLAAAIAKAKARLSYAQLQLDRTTTLARTDTATQQALDQAQNDMASASADLAEAQANQAAAQAGPTREERAIADTKVQAATASLAVLERRLDKTFLRAPADGVVTVIVGEIGEAVRAGQPVLTIEETGKRWLSFNAREDFLHGLTVGMKVEVERSGSRDTTPAVVTELLPLGSFAAWQAERAVGDYDLNTLRLRLDPQAEASAFEPGMTVWFYR